MPFDVLLLPLLGGYIFISHWNYTRYSTRRHHSGQRLILHAAVAGGAFLIIAYAIVIPVVELLPEQVAIGWQALVPFEYMGTSLLAFLMGAGAWWPLNRTERFSEENQALRAVEEWNDHLEILLIQAMEKARQIAITTSYRKVYIGFVAKSFNPVFERKFIVLLPTLSGHRDPDTLRYNLTTNYAKVLVQVMEGTPEVTVKPEEFEIVIPVSEIVSANVWDPAAYELFNSLPEGEEEEE